MDTAFNIALFPENKDLLDTCIYLAQSNLKNQASEYLLGENAYPHITLCQFNSTAEQVSSIWSTIANLQIPSVKINFHHIYLYPGTEAHTGKYWVGLTVTLSNTLISLQKTIYEKLLDLGIESETIPDVYFPHLTWARCEITNPITMSALPPQDLWQSTHSFTISLGQSDKNGVYQKRLY